MIVSRRRACLNTGVLVAGVDREHAEAEHLRNRVPNLMTRSAIAEARGKPLRNAELEFHLAQQQQSPIRRQEPAVE